MRLLASLLLVPLALASPLATPATTGQDAHTTLAPVSSTGDHIEDSYIVVFKKDVNLEQIALHMSDVEQWDGADVSALLSPLSI